jgi:alkylmercury lyase
MLLREQIGFCLTRFFDCSGTFFLKLTPMGVSLVPTRHRFQLDGKVLFTWCAFDTLLFPPTLGQTAQVSSTCPSTEQPITFVATPEGVVKDLTPAHSVLSLIIPANHQDCVRATFCEHSLFFASEQAASRYLASHPEAVLLSILSDS